MITIRSRVEKKVDESPMSQGTQKEMNKAWVIHPWKPRDEEM
jgi:hypothetical protein